MFKKTAFMFAAIFAVCAMALTSTGSAQTKDEKMMMGMGSSKVTTFSGQLMPGSHVTIHNTPDSSPMMGGYTAEHPYPSAMGTNHTPSMMGTYHTPSTMGTYHAPAMPQHSGGTLMLQDLEH